MSFPKFVYMTTNTPFFPILHVFAPLNDVRTYSAWSWKTTLITWIFGQAWYTLWHSSGPGKPTSIWQVLSFYLTFDPSFNLQFLKRNLIKLKSNLVSIPRKRNLFILKRFVLECSGCLYGIYLNQILTILFSKL